MVEVGAEQVSFSFSVFWCRLVTVELRETTFFRLDAFFATLESMLLDEVLISTTEENVDINKKKMLKTSSTAPSVIVDGISGCCQSNDPRRFSRRSEQKPVCLQSLHWECFGWKMVGKGAQPNAMVFIIYRRKRTRFKNNEWQSVCK